MRMTYLLWKQLPNERYDFFIFFSLHFLHYLTQRLAQTWEKKKNKIKVLELKAYFGKNSPKSVVYEEIEHPDPATSTKTNLTNASSFVNFLRILLVATGNTGLIFKGASVLCLICRGQRTSKRKYLPKNLLLCECFELGTPRMTQCHALHNQPAFKTQVAY